MAQNAPFPLARTAVNPHRILAVVLDSFVDLGIAAVNTFAVAQLLVGILPAAGYTENFLKKEEQEGFVIG